MLQFCKDYFSRPKMKTKCLIMAVGILFMGFFLSFLIPVNYGLDPYSFMNLSVSEALGISFGTYQLLFNLLLFAIVLWKGRELIGLGTLVNMVCIGYVTDFFRWVWSKTPLQLYFDDPRVVTLPKVLIFVIAIAGFVFSAAAYMNAGVGLSPYDAIPKILHGRFSGMPFALLRILYDYAAVLIGVLFGRVPPVGVLVMGVALGPVISLVGKLLEPLTGGSD